MMRAASAWVPDDCRKVGCRVLSIARTSVLFSTQDEAAGLVRSSRTQVDFVCQIVSNADWAAICMASAADGPSNAVAKALVARKDGKAAQAISHYNVGPLGLYGVDMGAECLY
jgi:hypothetical protein